MLSITQSGPDFGISGVLGLISATISLLYVSIELIKLFTFHDNVSSTPNKASNTSSNTSSNTTKPQHKQTRDPNTTLEGFDTLSESLLQSENQEEETKTLPRHIIWMYRMAITR
jgi:hypothetical protein